MLVCYGKICTLCTGTIAQQVIRYISRSSTGKSSLSGASRLRSRAGDGSNARSRLRKANAFGGGCQSEAALIVPRNQMAGDSPRQVEGDHTDPNRRTFAVLIDGENARHHIDDMLGTVSTYGDVVIKRVYGDFSRSDMRSWREKVNKFGLTTMHNYIHSNGKGVVDKALIIDAMDLCRDAGVTGFGICASDSDYTGLVRYLRENHMLVLGFGKALEGSEYARSFHRFYQVDDYSRTETASVTPVAAGPTESVVLPKKEYELIGSVYDKCYDKSLGGAVISVIKETLRGRVTSQSRNSEKFSEFLKKLEGYQYFSKNGKVLIRRRELSSAKISEKSDSLAGVNTVVLVNPGTASEAAAVGAKKSSSRMPLNDVELAQIGRAYDKIDSLTEEEHTVDISLLKSELKSIGADIPGKFVDICKQLTEYVYFTRGDKQYLRRKGVFPDSPSPSRRKLEPRKLRPPLTDAELAGIDVAYSRAQGLVPGKNLVVISALKLQLTVAGFRLEGKFSDFCKSLRGYRVVTKGSTAFVQRVEGSDASPIDAIGAPGRTVERTAAAPLTDIERARADCEMFLSPSDDETYIGIDAGMPAVPRADLAREQAGGVDETVLIDAVPYASENYAPAAGSSAKAVGASAPSGAPWEARDDPSRLSSRAAGEEKAVNQPRGKIFDELGNKNRKELQELAKRNNISAGKKSVEIIRLLLEAASAKLESGRI